MAVEMNEHPPGEAVWTEDRLKNPHAVADKQRRVRDMFAAIAPRYDLNNRLHSLGTDQRWRRKAAHLSRLRPEDVIVDVACGTGDLALAYLVGLTLLNASRAQLPTRGQVIGVDYTFAMLPHALGKTIDFQERVLPKLLRIAYPKWWRTKTASTNADSGLARIVQYVNGDAQNLPLPDACCDVVSIAFGIRNVADPMRALREFRRILRPGGRLVVLEFSRPTNPLIRRLYDFYCNQVMTRTAAWIAGDRTGAYRYLSASVETFRTREQMKADIESAGFAHVEVHPLTFGVAVIYVGLVKS